MNNKKRLFRMLCDGEQEWQGMAYDAGHAEEKCFSDEPPSGFARYTLQRWGKVKVSSSMKENGWVTEYKNQSLVNA